LPSTNIFGRIEWELLPIFDADLLVQYRWSDAGACMARRSLTMVFVAGPCSSSGCAQLLMANGGEKLEQQQLRFM